VFKSIKSWSLKDVILCSLLGTLFAVICLSTVLSLIGPVGPLFAAVGLGHLAFEFAFGIFLFSAIFAPYIMQKPGVATVVGLLTGFIQVLLASPFASTVWLSGLVQGFGVEVGFAIFGYKKWNFISIFTASTTAMTASFILAWQRELFADYTFGMLMTRIIIRWASAVLISAILGKFLADRLAKAGVLKSYPLGEGAYEFTSE